MSQVSETEDELRPEYDFAQMMPVAVGCARKKYGGAGHTAKPGCSRIDAITDDETNSFDTSLLTDELPSKSKKYMPD